MKIQLSGKDWSTVQNARPTGGRNVNDEIKENLLLSWQAKSLSKLSEDMLSNQMLSGIPEVDLGLEWTLNISTVYIFKIHSYRAKFKNIEATELAKQKIIEEERKG